MAQSIASAVTKLKQLRAELSDPSEFLREQIGSGRHAGAIAAAGRWSELARQTARDVVYFALPPNEDPTEWGLLADYVASQVRLELATGGRGVLISLGESQAEFSFTSVFGEHAPEPGTLTLEQLTAYVEAGLRGDPLGKPDITEYDAARDAQHTAYNILVAFHKRSFSGTREQDILKFVEARSLSVAGEHFEAIGQAWHALFSVVAPQDVAAWVQKTAQKTLT